MISQNEAQQRIKVPYMCHRTVIVAADELVDIKSTFEAFVKMLCVSVDVFSAAGFVAAEHS